MQYARIIRGNTAIFLFRKIHVGLAGKTHCMISFPNCKINIGLCITNKRKDGFHDIETVLYPLPLNDVLEIIKSDKNEFLVSGLSLQGSGEDNLCLRAYEILKKRFDIPPVKIHLHKVIPSGAGLGGGSANAAFTLKMLNELFKLGLSVLQLQEIASTLGSDCAFFIKNIPVFAKGKGNNFGKLRLKLDNYYILLVKPSVHISTAYAYSLVKPRATTVNLKNLDEENICDWKSTIANDFEEYLFPKFPELKAIKEKLYSLGALYVSMSGSGSCLYGIYEKSVEIKTAFHPYFSWQGKLN